MNKAALRAGATGAVSAVQPVRGLADDGCDQCAQGYCCPLDQVRAERDTLQAIAAAACLRIAELEAKNDVLVSLVAFARRVG